jgi:hypothetical protein
MRLVFKPNYCLVYRVIIPGSTTVERKLKFRAENVRMAREHVERQCKKNSALWITEMGYGTEKGTIKPIGLYVIYHRKIKLH